MRGGARTRREERESADARISGGSREARPPVRGGARTRREEGRKAKGLRVGDRVAYAISKRGAASELSNVAADRLVKIPKGVTDQQAAAIMLKGLTAHYLIRRTYRVGKGDYILVHAAAGGVGLLLCQWAKLLGAKVIGVVGSQAKADPAR